MRFMICSQWKRPKKKSISFCSFCLCICKASGKWHIIEFCTVQKKRRIEAYLEEKISYSHSPELVVISTRGFWMGIKVISRKSRHLFKYSFASDEDGSCENDENYTFYSHTWAHCKLDDFSHAEISQRGRDWKTVVTGDYSGTMGRMQIKNVQKFLYLFFFSIFIKRNYLIQCFVNKNTFFINFSAKLKRKNQKKLNATKMTFKKNEKSEIIFKIRTFVR